MLVIVVNQYVVGGFFDFLAHVKLDKKEFDQKKAQAERRSSLMGRLMETAHKTATSKSMEVAGERAEMPDTKDVEAEPSGEVQSTSQQVAVQEIAARRSMQAADTSTDPFLLLRYTSAEADPWSDPFVQKSDSQERATSHELPVVSQSIWDTGANQIINKQKPSWFMPFHRFETLVAQAEFQRSAEGQEAGQQLHQAVRDGETEQVQAMLSQRGATRADPNFKDSEGYTALIVAVSSGHVETVKALLGAEDIDVNAKDVDGYTALIRAAGRGNIETVKALLGAEDIDVNSKDKYGDTALIWAASYGHVETVKALLGAEDIDVNAKNNAGNTALDSAKSENRTGIGKHSKIVTLLREAGAK